jgi:hypothetical protein
VEILMGGAKLAESLTGLDLAGHPVWMFINSDARGETVVRPVRRVPVTSLSDKLLGVRVVLANGTAVWALVGNVSPQNARKTQQHLSISIERDGQWFHLARYFDPDYKRRGPSELAQFLGLSVAEVFPIAFDLTGLAKGDPEVLVGSVREEPAERLSEAERLELIFEELDKDLKDKL